MIYKYDAQRYDVNFGHLFPPPHRRNFLRFSLYCIVSESQGRVETKVFYVKPVNPLIYYRQSSVLSTFCLAPSLPFCYHLLPRSRRAL